MDHLTEPTECQAINDYHRVFGVGQQHRLEAVFGELVGDGELTRQAHHLHVVPGVLQGLDHLGVVQIPARSLVGVAWDHKDNGLSLAHRHFKGQYSGAR